jgi:hypothetical protein
MVRSLGSCHAWTRPSHPERHQYHAVTTALQTRDTAHPQRAPFPLGCLPRILIAGCGWPDRLGKRSGPAAPNDGVGGPRVEVRPAARQTKLLPAFGIGSKLLDVRLVQLCWLACRHERARSDDCPWRQWTCRCLQRCWINPLKTAAITSCTRGQWKDSLANVQHAVHCQLGNHHMLPMRWLHLTNERPCNRFPLILGQGGDDRGAH